jgi:hypothetical protein
MVSAFLELLTADTNLSTNLNDFRAPLPDGFSASGSVFVAAGSSQAE